MKQLAPKWRDETEIEDALPLSRRLFCAAPFPHRRGGTRAFKLVADPTGRFLCGRWRATNEAQSTAASTRPRASAITSSASTLPGDSLGVPCTSLSPLFSPLSWRCLEAQPQYCDADITQQAQSKDQAPPLRLEVGNSQSDAREQARKENCGPESEKIRVALFLNYWRTNSRILTSCATSTSLMENTLSETRD